ncbi:hypothetical protein [Algihabitans albus]|uniref:hypothetical protein n=1 Tax=Algihabitans albus TaxID=2164067 RepID=UPI000E5D1BB8|nr:hypothetical protein [Algihabitans albus]
MKQLLVEAAPLMDQVVDRWRRASVPGKIGQGIVLLALTWVLLVLLYQIKCALGIDVFADGGVHDVIRAVKRQVKSLLLG